MHLSTGHEPDLWQPPTPTRKCNGLRSTWHRSDPGVGTEAVITSGQRADTSKIAQKALTSTRADQGGVARGGVEPPTFRFSGGRSYQLSYLAGHRPRGPVMVRPRRDSNPRPSP